MMGKKENKYSVYLHVVPNGKKYIGITGQEPEARWLNGKGYQKQPYFYNAIQKYGWKNIQHTVVQTGLTKEQAEELEVNLIYLFKTNDRDYGYNIASGGHVLCVSEETKEKLRKVNTGKKHSKETCEKLRKLEVERWKDPEYRENQVKKRLGKTPWNKGKKTPIETRKKLSLAKQGKYVGAKHWNSKPIINLDTGETFESIGLAAKRLGKKNGSKIVLACKGKKKTAHGFRWAYCERG